MFESRPVVITALGAVSPLGLSFEQTWEGICTGRCGIRPITAFDAEGFDCRIAGQVPEYNIQKSIPKFHRKAAKLMSRDIELAVLAAKDAFDNSGLVTKAAEQKEVTVDPARMAINIGAGLISCDLPELGPAIARSVTQGRFDIRKWGADGITAITPLWLLKYLPNMLACHIGIIHDIRGPSNTITCGEASGQLAIGEAASMLARGSADVALAGGGEAKVNPIVILRQCLLKRTTSKGNNNSESACRPFDMDASGSVFGEGAAMVLLETIEHAQKRGAKIRAQIAGFGSSNSINEQYEHLEKNGKGLRIAIEKAMTEAGIESDQLDLIIPHGTAIPCDDLAEATAIQDALGKHAARIPTLPTKSMLSHTGAASGAMDVAIAAAAMERGFIPAAKNCERKAEGCNLNINKQARHCLIRYALCCSYTFGGQTAALVLKNHQVPVNS
ncbi:MAG: beta-ketoacyl-[acyl-carrier-protein] synthase family protein [Planctomycetota bacterium]